MEWIYLGFAILLEVCGTTFMKLSAGLTNLKFAVLMLLFYFFSFGMLSLALKDIEIGTAYAIWSGIGIALITAIGVIFFDESFTVEKTIFIGFIIIGAIGLKLFQS
jgi:small multidrug resistance pump